MCGIGGILTWRRDLELQPKLDAMVTQLRHRGPDAEGTVETSLPNGVRLGLAHTRLAILDLSSAGHQPMCDAHGSWIVFNGEIYNHLLLRRELAPRDYRSTSDTETILAGWHDWGNRVLERLRGMFAFALYDAPRRQFWLVRDRLGIKPLYVAQADRDTWVFGSEIRTILSSGLIPRSLCAQGVESYLAFGATMSPWTLVRGVDSLLPSETWQFDLNAEQNGAIPNRSRYWQLRFAPADARMDYSQGIEKLKTTLRESMALHMLSDVPVGVFLSGGIDSSSLVATLAYQGYGVRTFSVRFGESDFDESQHARDVALLFGTQHTELTLAPSKVLTEIDLALSTYDQPSIDGINTYFICKAVHEAGLAVAISGLGGDEIFAGYESFRRARWIEMLIYRLLARLTRPILQVLSPDHIRTKKLGAIVDNNAGRLGDYAILRQVMMSAQRAAILKQSTIQGAIVLPELVASTLRDSAASLDAVNANSLFELSLYVANMLLRDTDQMSMSQPVEVRVPLLDHVIVEETAGLPGANKLPARRHGLPKRMLLDALPARLPRSAVDRPKMGFVFPWELWLRQELKPFVDAILRDERAVQNAGLAPVAVRSLWQQFLNKKPGIRYTDILALTHLIHWVQKHQLHIA